MPIFFKGFEVVQGYLIHEFVSEFWLYSQNFFLWNSKRTKLFFFDVYAAGIKSVALLPPTVFILPSLPFI